MLLDEFTNAIDDKTEKLILGNIKKLKNKTLIMISHKKNTIDYFDKVCIYNQEFLKIINERKKKILIVGGAGYIGIEMSKDLIKEGYLVPP